MGLGKFASHSESGRSYDRGFAGHIGKISQKQQNNLGKPVEPKEAWREVLRRGGRKPSAKIFGELAEGVSLSKCQDRAFRKLVAVLRSWFPS